MAKIFRLTLTGDYLGQNWANVFHYTSVSDDASQAGDLIGAFYTYVLPALKNAANTRTNFTHQHVVDVPDTGDYADESYTDQHGLFGANTSSLPPNYTNNIVLNTTGSVIRHGFKHLVGQDEGSLTNGVYTSTYLGFLQDVGNAIVADLTFDIHTFVPVIARYAGSPPVITLTAPITGFSVGLPSALKTRKP